MSGFLFSVSSGEVVTLRPFHCLDFGSPYCVRMGRVAPCLADEDDEYYEYS